MLFLVFSGFFLVSFWFLCGFLCVSKTKETTQEVRNDRLHRNRLSVRSRSLVSFWLLFGFLMVSLRFLCVLKTEGDNIQFSVRSRSRFGYFRSRFGFFLVS